MTLSIVTAIIGAILLGIGVVGYLFRPVGVIKRILFLLAAAGLLIPIVHSGKFSPDLGQQRYRTRVGNFTCVGRVVGALISRPRADSRGKR